nr:protoporphyrinogen oxidase [Bacillus piscicola]
MKVAIIGGGITGLTAAYYLQKEILANQLDIKYELFEKDNRLGGKIKTDYHDGFVIEQGPDSFLARKTHATKLAKEVGLEEELVSNRTGQAYVLKGETLHAIPPGAVMGIPTKLGPFLTTNLFSAVGKLRAGADLFLPRRRSLDDQSLGHFFRRRLGSEVVDNLIEPLLSGIYAGDIDQLSLQSTFPQFQQVEQSHRSLIVGMKASQPQAPPKNKKSSGFLSFRNGLQSFVHAIENHLDEDRIHKNTAVKNMTMNGRQCEIELSDGKTEVFDKVIITTPPHITARFLKDEAITKQLEEIPSTSVATVAMAFDSSQLSMDFDGTGFVVSKKSDYTITACTWTHRKWEHTAPKGKALLRCYVGKPGGEGIVEESDETIVESALKDLRRVMKINGDPEYYQVTRWRNAMPQYVVNHQKWVEKLRETINSYYPGTFLAGGAYEGVGLPDCILQGENAVDQLIKEL